MWASSDLQQPSATAAPGSLKIMPYSYEPTLHPGLKSIEFIFTWDLSQVVNQALTRDTCQKEVSMACRYPTLQQLKGNYQVTFLDMLTSGNIAHVFI